MGKINVFIDKIFNYFTAHSSEQKTIYEISQLTGIDLLKTSESIEFLFDRGILARKLIYKTPDSKYPCFVYYIKTI